MRSRPFARFSFLLGLLPAALLGLFAFESGTLAGAATALGAGLGVVAVLAFILLVGSREQRWWDPLRLGPWFWLPWLGWAWLLLGVALSPVPRAGWSAVVLVPAYLLLPAAVARCRKAPAARRWGMSGVAVVVVAVAGVALATTWQGVTDGDLASRWPSLRAARPLGHHSALALWLVLLLPLTLVPVRGHRPRWFQWVALALGVAAVVATRSLAGGLALASQGLMIACFHFRSREKGRRLSPVLWLVGFLVLLPLLGLLPRIGSVLMGEDSSTAVRRAYQEAGLRGIAVRPWVGWGAGATAWTVAEFLRPEPGVHPPGEAVGHLHSLPFQVAYEVGIPGLVLVLVTVGILIRRGLRSSVNDPLRRAGWVGLVGGAVASLAGADPGVTALPVAAAVVVGAVLPGPEGRLRRRRVPWVKIYALAAAAWLVQPMAALRHYDLAARMPSGALLDLRQAVQKDPTFPLYRARLALLEGDAGQALKAAEDAHGVAALWLLAGRLGAEENQPWTAGPLLQACRLDPLAAAASYRLAGWTAESGVLDGDGAAHHAARALLTEPKLAAGGLFVRHPTLQRPTLEAIRRWPGVDEGLKLALLAAVEEQWGGAPPNSGPGADLLLTLSLDGVPAESLSLFLFHRRPWPAELMTVRLLAPAPRLLEIPSASRQKNTAAASFAAETCAPPVSPASL